MRLGKKIKLLILIYFNHIAHHYFRCYLTTSSRKGFIVLLQHVTLAVCRYRNSVGARESEYFPLVSTHTAWCMHNKHKDALVSGAKSLPSSWGANVKELHVNRCIKGEKSRDTNRCGAATNSYLHYQLIYSYLIIWVYKMWVKRGKKVPDVRKNLRIFQLQWF